MIEYTCSSTYFKTALIKYITKEASEEACQEIFTKFVAEKKIAQKFDLIYVGENNQKGYDAIGYDGKKYEIKTTTKAKSQLTVHRLKNKEDIIYIVYPNVIDDKFHHFYFPKDELPYVVKKTNIEWEITDNIKNRTSIIEKDDLIKFPKNYKSIKNDTWKKKFMRDHALSFKELYRKLNGGKKVDEYRINTNVSEKCGDILYDLFKDGSDNKNVEE